MLRSNLKSAIREIQFKLIPYRLKQCNKFTQVRFYYKLLTSHPYKQLFTNNCSSKIIFPSRLNSVQATVESKAVKDQQIKSCFQEQLHIRKMQAGRSVLVQLNKKADIPYAFAHCKQFGLIKHAFSYSGENKGFFLLFEFSDKTSVDSLLQNCESKKVPGIIPVSSRLLQYEKKFDNGVLEATVTEENIPVSSLKPGASISEIIQDIYLTEKLTELDVRLRYFFCTIIKESISGFFHTCEVVPFGSSVNGIGRHGCDLDVSVILDSKQVNSNTELYFDNRKYSGKDKIYQQKMVFLLGEIFRTFFPGISLIERVLHARVPIVKMYNNILKLQCDLSVDNMSPFHMSNIIHFYGEIDYRVRPLMYAVKKWAKEADVTYSHPGSWISNFGLTNLVIFFLQNRPRPILPSLNDAVLIIGEDNSLELKFLKSIEEWRSCASLNTESLEMLLKEFLVFLATEPFEESIISLMSGKNRTRPQESGLPICVIYPFDESLNMTKNISPSEFAKMKEKAEVSAKCLESNIKQTSNHANDFCIMLGIPPDNSLPDVNSLIKDDKSSRKVKHG